MGWLCPLCEKQVQNLSSHLGRVHKMDGPERKFWFQQGKTSHQRFSPYPQKKTSEVKCNQFQLLHPFTALVTGMTGSGKTVWVQKLLEHASQVIEPPPQRILWSYSQWQPAYDQMLKVVPGIEFVKGIPHDIEEDWYFDPQINNLMVIDDQMSETSNDKRILNLFTKGSHHRNLSVIFLLQNVYFQGKIMRTLSLNASYLVLFKNPRDKLQMMALGKQMYPGKTGHFLQKYEDAVQRPYGYLFVDLKPNTPDGCRLRTNVLPNDPPLNQTGGQWDAASTMASFFKRLGYLQPPQLKVMQGLEEEMNDILNDSNLPPDVKKQKYMELFNRLQAHQRQLAHTVSPGVGIPNTSFGPDQSQTSNMITQQSTPLSSTTDDSGIETLQAKTPSFLKRFTSKIKTPSFRTASTSKEQGIPSTPLKAPFFTPSTSTPINQPVPRASPPEFLLSPPSSQEKPASSLRYQGDEEHIEIPQPPVRRSERIKTCLGLYLAGKNTRLAVVACSIRNGLNNVPIVVYLKSCD